MMDTNFLGRNDCVYLTVAAFAAVVVVFVDHIAADAAADHEIHTW